MDNPVFAIPLQRKQRGVNLRMNVLEKILEGIENESRLAHEEMRRCASENPLQFDEAKGYARGVEYVAEIIRSHMDEINKLKKKLVGEMDVMHHESYDLGRNVGWNECLKIMQQNTNDDWIPVEERLPEGGTCVMCCFDDGAVDVLWQNWQEDKSLLFYADIDNEIRKAIAWQPLPEAYHPKQAPAAEHIMSRFTRVE